MKAKFTPILMAICVIFAISSCSKALSDEHVKYLGQWGSDKHSIEIWKNGRGVYQKKQNAPIECWVKIKNGKIKFKTGQATIKSFDIDSDPFVNQDGYTIMILDDRTFYKH